MCAWFDEILETESEWFTKVRSSEPAWVLQSLMVISLEPDAILCPSVEKAAEVT
jgi:hypothetical protein